MEGWKREEANQMEVIIAVDLHVVRFLDKIGERRRLDIQKIQKVKVKTRIIE
jgi:hypothetical protein